MCAAARHPFTDLIGHPTGRLLLSREPYAVDMGAVLAAARESGCAMELNSQPQRLVGERDLLGGRQLGDVAEIFWSAMQDIRSGH